MLARAFRVCGLAVMAVVSFVGAARAEPESPADDPRALFQAGVNYLQEKPDPRYEEALKLFQASYAKSGNFRALLPMGVCELHLERDGDAIAHFQQYLSQGGALVPPDLRAQAERDIATLSASLVNVTVRVEPVGATLVDERTPAQGVPVINRYAVTQPTITLGMRPGHHEFTVASENHVSETRSFDADPGANLTFQFQLKKKATSGTSTPAGAKMSAGEDKEPRPEPKAAPVPVGVYVAAAGTVVLLGAAVGTGLMAGEKATEFQELNELRDREAGTRRDEATRLYVASDVLLVGAVVTAALTGYLYFTRNSGSEGRKEAAGGGERDRFALRVVPEVGRQVGKLTLSAEF